VQGQSQVAEERKVSFVVIRNVGSSFKDIRKLQYRPGGSSLELLQRCTLRININVLQCVLSSLFATDSSTQVTLESLSLYNK
jgi:hypothetical protein